MCLLDKPKKYIKIRECDIARTEQNRTEQILVAK